jgi:hypothetical protein
VVPQGPTVLEQVPRLQAYSVIALVVHTSRLCVLSRACPTYGSVEDTKLSTNKQHSLSLTRRCSRACSMCLTHLMLPRRKLKFFDNKITSLDGTSFPPSLT